MCLQGPLIALHDHVSSSGSHRSRQLLHRQLPALLRVEEGGGRDRRAAGAGGAADRRPARALPAHPVLPEAVSFLLLPRLHRQERHRGPGLPRRARPRVGAVQRSSRRSPAGRSTSSTSAAARPRISRPRSSRASCGGWTRSARGARRRRSRSSASRERSPRASSRPSATSASRGSASASRTSTIAILEANGRAHRSPEIGRSYAFARSLDFPQINIDLIAGMLGETDENWQTCVEQDDRHGARQRDHLPDGAAVQHDDQPEPADGQREPSGRSPAGRPSAAGCRRRSMRSKRAGYIDRVGLYSGEEPVDEVRLSRSAVAGRRHGRPRRRIVRPRQRRAHAEPGHVRGLLQRASRPARCRWPARSGRAEERLIREFVLQLKLGSIRPSYFEQKYGVDVLDTLSARSSDELGRRRPARRIDADRVTLSRDGLLQVDSLLPRFFKPEHASVAIHLAWSARGTKPPVTTSRRSGATHAADVKLCREAMKSAAAHGAAACRRQAAGGPVSRAVDSARGRRRLRPELLSGLVQ